MTVLALAPAKLNLGLEVIRRREDGYHDICTVMVAISLFDRLTVSLAPTFSFATNEPRIAGENNLVVRAARQLTSMTTGRSANIYLEKRIPLASGLGGASSNAAAALLGLGKELQLQAPAGRLVEIGARLGSDVPFFFTPGAALIEGRGERITQLPPPRELFAVVVVPHIDIPAKTAALYHMLRPKDFSPGDHVRASAGRWSPETMYLENAFAHPLYEFKPELREIPKSLRRAGAEIVALSGAGPAHYALHSDFEQAHEVARRVRTSLITQAHISVVRIMKTGILLMERAGAIGI